MPLDISVKKFIYRAEKRNDLDSNHSLGFMMAKLYTCNMGLGAAKPQCLWGFRKSEAQIQTSHLSYGDSLEN